MGKKMESLNDFGFYVYSEICTFNKNTSCSDTTVHYIAFLLMLRRDQPKFWRVRGKITFYSLVFFFSSIYQKKSY